MRLPVAMGAACALVGCAWGADFARSPQQQLPVREEAVGTAALSPPRGLRARSGELRFVPLSWTPVLTGDVAGYRIERSTNGEDFEPIATAEGRFASTFVDRGQDFRLPEGHLADGTEYHYRVRAVDSLDRGAPGTSAAAVATTAPTPAPPEGLRSFNHLPRMVALTWNASEDPTVDGYLVYRSPSAGGPFERVGRVQGRFRTRFLDEGLGDLRVLYYQLATVSRAGATGTPGEPVLAVTKAEPLPPADLRLGEKRLGVNVLEWEPNVEPDIAGYRVLRDRGEDSPAEIIAVLPSGVTRFEDMGVGAGEAVSYALVAFDADGLESLPTDPLGVVSDAYDLTAEVRGRAVHLHWNPRRAEGFDRARVYRHGLFGMREIAQVTTEVFVDERVEPGRSYRYAVRLEREGPPPAPVSGALEIEVPDSKRERTQAPPEATHPEVPDTAPGSLPAGSDVGGAPPSARTEPR